MSHIIAKRKNQNAQELAQTPCVFVGIFAKIINKMRFLKK